MLVARVLRKILCYCMNYFPFADRFSGNKTIYLTFDDGPDPIHSNKIMDILCQYGIKATFFVVGSKIEPNKETVLRMVREGHVLGNHTNTHRVLPHITKAERIQEVEECQKLIDSLQDTKVRIFRPPQGLICFGDLLYLMFKKYSIMLWSIDSNDYRYSKDIETRLKNLSKSNYVILFHDDNSFCFDSLKNLLPIWIEQDFNFAVPKPEVYRRKL